MRYVYLLSFLFLSEGRAEIDSLIPPISCEDVLFKPIKNVADSALFTIYKQMYAICLLDKALENKKTTLLKTFQDTSRFEESQKTIRRFFSILSNGYRSAQFLFANSGLREMLNTQSVNKE